jgi:hypothetical protein
VPFFLWTLGLGQEGLVVAASLLTVMQFAGLVGPIGVAYLFDRYNQKAVLLVSLALSSFATAWLLFQHQLGPALILNILLYGSMTYARGTLTQAVVAESAPPEQIDVAFSLYRGLQPLLLHRVHLGPDLDAPHGHADCPVCGHRVGIRAGVYPGGVHISDRDADGPDDEAATEGCRGRSVEERVYEDSPAIIAANPRALVDGKTLPPP